MSVDFKTKFSINPGKNVVNYPVQENIDKNVSETVEPVTQTKNHTLRDISIGAVGATTVLVTLGVLARKGKFGTRLQKYLGGTVKNVETHAHNADNTSVVKPSSNKPQTPSPQDHKPVQTQPKKPIQAYTTELAETVKEYKTTDIEVNGVLFGKQISKNPIADAFRKAKNSELTVLYNDAEKSTEIIIPFGRDCYDIKINGIISADKAKTIYRTLNANGIYKPEHFPQVISGVLNGKYNTLYTNKNIGIYYDFHDNGAWKFDGGGKKSCTDGRIFLYKVKENKKWEGYEFQYILDSQKRSTTQIAVPLPICLNERKGSHYTIFLDGIIPPGTVHRLINHLEKDVIQNPKDVKFEELAKIQEATLKFLNAN